MTPLTEFSERNHFLRPKVAAVDPYLIEIRHCARMTKKEMLIGDVDSRAIMVGVCAGVMMTPAWTHGERR